MDPLDEDLMSRVEWNAKTTSQYRDLVFKYALFIDATSWKLMVKGSN